MLKDGSNYIKLWNSPAAISNGTSQIRTNWRGEKKKKKGTGSDSCHRRKTENKCEKLEYYTGL